MLKGTPWIYSKQTGDVCFFADKPFDPGMVEIPVPAAVDDCVYLRVRDNQHVSRLVVGDSRKVQHSRHAEPLAPVECQRRIKLTVAHTGFVEHNAVRLQRIFTQCGRDHSHGVFCVDFHHIIGEDDADEFKIFAVTLHKFFDVNFVLQIIVRFPVTPDHRAVKDLRGLYHDRQEVQRALAVVKEIPRIVRGHVRNQIGDFGEFFSCRNGFALKDFALIRFHVDRQFCEMDVDRQRSMFQRLSVARVRNAFARRRVQADMEVP